MILGVRNVSERSVRTSMQCLHNQLKSRFVSMSYINSRRSKGLNLNKVLHKTGTRGSQVTSFDIESPLDADMLQVRLMETVVILNVPF
ncbi:hypothetical protein RRG08_025406 [Elysia crispata]|uniref:Uncharacterized protein n=1 Tax=Elysia crispata TaxID=231223 RepID=A0AAE0Z8M4_9GAST|nr:hypothetical protein RRG08_025406 [Elysia crispata]